MKANGTNTKSDGNRNCRGIALLLTLGILVLLTLLALGFSSSQLTESQAARNFYYAAKAEEMALGGLETAIAVLSEDSRKSCYDDLYERWAIYYDKKTSRDDGFAGDEEEDADLSDFDEFQYDVDETGVFGNASARKDPWDDPQPDSRWIEIRAVDPATGEARLAGRYAVSIEDESAKVNINTAGNPDPDPQNISWKQRQYLGFTAAEIDLGGIFQNLGDLFSDVFKDPSRYPETVSDQTALDVVAYRYGWRSRWDADHKNLLPGEVGDDNFTDQMEQLLRQDFNGIDDDGDGRIDEERETGEPAEEDDEPGEFDPYDPVQITAPGQLLVNPSPSKGVSGVMGDDIPYLTVSQIKMAKSVSEPGKGYSFKDRTGLDPLYPKDRLYRSLLPYITVYSNDMNRFSNRDVGTGDIRGGITWMMRENIGRWLDRGLPEVHDFLSLLKRRGIAFTSTDDDTLRQIASNIYDFIDPDWLPSQGAQALPGVEPTVYLNEVDPTPPDLLGTQVGLTEEVIVEDYGEYIELWNPYDIPLDVSGYNATIDRSRTPTPIEDMDLRTSMIVEPRRFFLIGDTLGDVVNIGQGTRSPNQTFRDGWPPGCNAYAPLKLDTPLYMRLEVKKPGTSVTLLLEEHDDIPIGNQFDSAQKDDPRVMDRKYWRLAAPSPRAINPNTAPGNIYSHFYHPGVRSRARDKDYHPSDPSIYLHGGGLSNIGELGMVHRGEPWRTLNFTHDSVHIGDENDVKLLDLLTLPYPYAYSAPVPVSDRLPARNFVPGRININTAPPEILLGLNWDNMFDEMRSYGVRLVSSHRYAMIQYILDHRPYPNLANVAKLMADFPPLRNAPQAAREAFMRYNANLITTKSSVFKVTVLAEAFDRRGSVVATRKLEAVVDRGYTPGSFDRPNEPDPSRNDQRRAETARLLNFQWLTED